MGSQARSRSHAHTVGDDVAPVSRVGSSNPAGGALCEEGTNNDVGCVEAHTQCPGTDS